MAVKNSPLRMCIACREMKDKKELLRLVRSPEGEVRLDLGGKAAGRGAYICQDPDCIQKARKSKGLERALKTAIPTAIWDQIANSLLPQDRVQ